MNLLHEFTLCISQLIFLPLLDAIFKSLHDLIAETYKNL